MESSLDMANMPPNYAHSMDQMKAFQHYARANKGQSQKPKDPTTMMMRQQSGIQAAKQQQTLEAGVMITVIVGEPHPPCTKSLDTLEPITIAQLRTETHHRGKVLFVRRIGGLVPARSGVVAVVCGQEGNVELLKLAHGDVSLGEDGLLPTNAVLAIKEPYYTFGPERTGELRVDHPSDILYLSLIDHRIPSGFVLERESHAQRVTTALEMKNAGNVALKQRKYVVAANCYTLGLGAAHHGDMSIQRDLYRNRSQANIKMENYEAAKTDALAALLGATDPQSKDLDSKAYYRAGCAAYHLRDLEEAQTFFTKQLELVPGDHDGENMQRKVEARLLEQKSGDYDFSMLTHNLSKTNSRTEAADFLANTEIKPSAGCGRGLFATVDLRPGDLVLCEKALCVLFEHEEQYFHAAKYDVRTEELTEGSSALWKVLVNKLHRSPSSIHPVTSLSSKYSGLGNTETVVDGNIVVDTFQVHDIVVRNGYGCPTPSKKHRSEEFGFHVTKGRQYNSGIWTHASYINHACVPNSNRTFIGDLIVFRALKPIAKGEEITTAYKVIPDYDERQKEFVEQYGFRCSCILCKAEGADSPAERSSRKRVQKAALAFEQRHKVRDENLPSEDLIEEAVGFAIALRVLYDDRRYAGVPRYAALSLQAWLMQAYWSRRDSAKYFAAVEQYFKLLAYDQVTITKKKLTLRAGKGSALDLDAVRALQCAARLMVNKVGVAKKLDAMAEEMYVILNGVADGYVGITARVAEMMPR